MTLLRLMGAETSFSSPDSPCCIRNRVTRLFHAKQLLDGNEYICSIRSIAHISLTILLASSISEAGEAGPEAPEEVVFLLVILVLAGSGCMASPLLNIFLRPALIEYFGFLLFLSKSKMTAYSKRAVNTRKMQMTR